MEEGQLVNTVHKYHLYSCKEQAMFLLQVSSLSLVMAGLGAAVKYMNSGRDKEATTYAFAAMGSAAFEMYAKIRKKEFANKVEDTRVELRNLELKLLEKRDPLSLPIQTKRDTENKKRRVATYSFYRI
jgi:hypothetical protein